MQFNCIFVLEGQDMHTELRKRLTEIHYGTPSVSENKLFGVYIRVCSQTHTYIQTHVQSFTVHIRL